MTSDGDITDTFGDDDDLARSIERGNSGPWNDDAQFVEPTAFALRENLQTAAAEPRAKDYHERRLLELQQRIAQKEKAAAAPQVWGAPDARSWQPDDGAETRGRAQPAPAETTRTRPVEPPPAAEAAPPARRTPWLPVTWLAVAAALLGAGIGRLLFAS